MKTAVKRILELDALLDGSLPADQKAALRQERLQLSAYLSPDQTSELAHDRLLARLTLGAPAPPADPFTGMGVARMEPEPHYVGRPADTRAWVPGARRAPGQATPMPKPFCYRCRREVDEWAVEPELVGDGVTMTARCHGAEEAQRLDGATLRGMKALLLHPAFAPAAPRTLGPREEPGPLSNLMASLKPRRRT